MHQIHSHECRWRLIWNKHGKLMSDRADKPRRMGSSCRFEASLAGHEMGSKLQEPLVVAACMEEELTLKQVADQLPSCRR